MATKAELEQRVSQLEQDVLDRNKLVEGLEYQIFRLTNPGIEDREFTDYSTYFRGGKSRNITGSLLVGRHPMRLGSVVLINTIQGVIHTVESSTWCDLVAFCSAGGANGDNIGKAIRLHEGR